MVILISVMIVLIGLYIVVLAYDIKEIKKQIDELSFELLDNEKRIGDVDHRNMINEQLINWLCDEVAKKKAKTKKEGKTKNDNK